MSHSLVKRPTDAIPGSPLAPASAMMNTNPSKSDQLEMRFIEFASTIVSLSEKLPKTPQGRHISNQVAESRADFVHKLRVVFKELNETTIWLEIIARSSLLPPPSVEP